VSRSSYYEWASRPLSALYLADAELANKIYDIHVASQRTYGAPRVDGQLRHRGRRHS
jgi:putative transposase